MMPTDLREWPTRDLVCYASQQTAKLLRGLVCDGVRSVEAEEVAAVLLELLSREAKELESTP